MRKKINFNQTNKNICEHLSTAASNFLCELLFTKTSPDILLCVGPFPTRP